MDCYWDSRCTDETRATKALLQAQRRARKQRLRSSQGTALVSTMDGSRLAFARVAVDTGLGNWRFSARLCLGESEG
eukprot:4921642-Amphidinium_carterae.1